MNKSNGYWIAIGVGVGTSLGVATGDLATWIAVGVGFGAMMTAGANCFGKAKKQ